MPHKVMAHKKQVQTYCGRKATKMQRRLGFSIHDELD